MELGIFEARCLIEKLRTFDLREIGNREWTEQHTQIQRLNIQAHHGAQQRHDEYIVDEVVSQAKIAVLIQDLITTEVWKAKVLPHIETHLTEDLYVKVYMLMYHEAILINLLEVLLFHAAAVEVADDLLIELVDYCSRKMATTVSQQLSDAKSESSSSGDPSLQERIQQTKSKLEFGISASALSVLRFVTDRVASLPVAVLNRILNHNDVLMSLVPLLLNFPWIRRGDNGLEKFEDGDWRQILPTDARKVTKMEAQLWLSVYNLTMDNTCRQRYELHDYRKSCLLQMRKFMNQILLDQLPMLKDLRRMLEELSLRNMPAATESSLICIQMVPEVWENLMRQDFEEIGRWQLSHVFSSYSDRQRREDMTRLAEVYNVDSIESLLDDPKCAKCGKAATKRCSRCKLEWYCGRECQIRSWTQHKTLCDVVSEQ